MAADDSAQEHPRGRRVKPRRRAAPAATGRVPSLLAAGTVGLLVAVLGRLLIFVGERGCDAVRGTATCGGAGGVMLVVIVAVMVYVGTRLMRMLAVPEPAVTSVLGMALLTVAILAALVDQIFSLWMWVVLPVLAAVLYAFAAWAAQALTRSGSG